MDMDFSTPSVDVPKAFASTGPRTADPSGEVDARIGDYRVLRALGLGGMGQVFLAETLGAEPRRVAIKLLRDRIVPEARRRRFTREQKAMEQLDHPNVGRILDAGTTEDGAPYLVMEWIQGVPITTYCDQHALSIDHRLRLFLDVCRGVGHAHRRWLLHRDIKPANVLVTVVGGRPAAKLIDFGIAKALDASVETGLSATGAVGTPTHMSPEALLGEGEVDARADVFSLGVLLHTLLIGRLPWAGLPHSPPIGSGRFARPSLTPSAQLDRLDPVTAAAIAELRGDTVAGLRRQLRGDLDAIVQKAIADDPEARYGLVEKLRADIQRYRAAKPVRAMATWSPGYLAAKAWRRSWRSFARGARARIKAIQDRLSGRRAAD